MKKSIAIIAVVVSMLLVLFAVSGCSGKNIAEKIAEEAIEKAIEKDSGDNVEIDLGDGEMTIQGDDGEVTIGEGTGLPDGFPGDVPVYPDMKIATSWKSSDGDKSTYSITAVSEKSVDEVFSWYKSELGSWEITNEFTLNTDEGNSSFLNATKGELELAVSVMETDEGTTVVQNVTE